MAGMKKFLFINASEGYHEENATDDQLSLGGLTMAGAIAMANNKITGLGAPDNGGDATNKTYVDNLASGLQWRTPVIVPGLLGNVNCYGLVGNAAASVIEGLTPAEGDAYVITTADGAGALTTATVGDIWQYVSAAWVKLVTGVGGFVPVGTYGLLSTVTALIAPYTDTTDDGKRAYFDGTTNTGALVTPAKGDAYVISNTGAKWNGGIQEWSSTAWVEILAGSGGYVPAGSRAILALTPSKTLIAPYTEATDDCKIVSFTGLSNTGTNTGHATEGSAVLVDGENSYYENWGFVFDGTVPTGSWIQFTGAGQINAGDGLTKDGNTLNVGRGDGISVGADTVNVDLSSSNPGLELTGTSPTKTLQAKVDGAHGIIRNTSGLEIEIDDSPDTLDVDADGLKVVGLPTLFKINDIATGSTVTAPYLDTLTNGSDASALHYHQGGEAHRIEDTLLNEEIIATRKVVRWGTVADKIKVADNGAAATARAIGIARVGGAADPGTSQVVKYGFCDGALNGAGVVNTPYYLGTAGALVVFASVPRPGRIIRMGFGINVDDIDVQIMDYGQGLA